MKNLLLNNPRAWRNLQLMVRALHKEGRNIQELSYLSGLPIHTLTRWLYQSQSKRFAQQFKNTNKKRALTA